MAGSAIFNQPSYEAVIATMRQELAASYRVSDRLCLQAFDELKAEGFNRIPISRSVLADTETPLSAYNKLARGTRSFLFESVQGGERWGRYSIIGLPASRWLSATRHQVKTYQGDDLIECVETSDPLATIDAMRSAYLAPHAAFAGFHGGWVGYFSYDTVRFVEPRLADHAPRDDLGMPDISLMLAEEVVIFDNLAGALTIVINADCTSPDAIIEPLPDWMISRRNYCFPESRWSRSRWRQKISKRLNPRLAS